MTYDDIQIPRKIMTKLVRGAADGIARADRHEGLPHVGNTLGQLLVWLWNNREWNLAAVLVFTWIEAMKQDKGITFEDAIEGVRRGITGDLLLLPDEAVTGTEQDRIAALYVRGRSI